MNQQSNATYEFDSPVTIVFPEGIPGFEHLKAYHLTYSDTAGGRLYRLRPEDDPEIEFTLVDPQFYSLNYVLALDDTEQALLQAERPEEILVLLMLWKDSENTPGGLHANISGPILINMAKRLGMQKVIGNPRMEVSISNA